MRKKLATMLLATVLFMSITLPFAKAEIGPHDHIPYVITDVPYTYIVGSPMVCQETQYYNLTVCALCWTELSRVPVGQPIQTSHTTVESWLGCDGTWLHFQRRCTVCSLVTATYQRSEERRVGKECR